jgi:hypothetical protein
MIAVQNMGEVCLQKMNSFIRHKFRADTFHKLFFQKLKE